jgi:hypothetical protein
MTIGHARENAPSGHEHDERSACTGFVEPDKRRIAARNLDCFAGIHTRFIAAGEVLGPRS